MTQQTKNNQSAERNLTTQLSKQRYGAFIIASNNYYPLLFRLLKKYFGLSNADIHSEDILAQVRKKISKKHTFKDIWAEILNYVLSLKDTLPPKNKKSLGMDVLHLHAIFSKITKLPQESQQILKSYVYFRSTYQIAEDLKVEISKEAITAKVNEAIRQLRDSLSVEETAFFKEFFK